MVAQGSLWRYIGALGKLWRLRPPDLPDALVESHRRLLLQARGTVLPHLPPGDDASTLQDLLARLAGASPSRSPVHKRVTFNLIEVAYPSASGLIITTTPSSSSSTSASPSTALCNGAVQPEVIATDCEGDRQGPEDPDPRAGLAATSGDPRMAIIKQSEPPLLQALLLDLLHHLRQFFLRLLAQTATRS